MDVTTRPDERLDGFDREKFSEMVESASFRLFSSRISAELARLIGECRRLTEPSAIYRAQGAANLADTILHLPAKILAEMDAHPKKR